MNLFKKQEEAVALFEQALKNAGMVDSYELKSNPSEGRPAFWRTKVGKSFSQEPLYLRYQVTDNLEAESADDQFFIGILYINGEVVSNNGFDDEQYQLLCQRIEDEVTALGFNIGWTSEPENTDIDVDNPLWLKYFEVQKKIY